MKNFNVMLSTSVVLCIALLATPAPARAVDAGHSPLAAFGEERFPPLYREALQAYVDSAAAYRQGDYRKAARALDALWARHPAGSTEWKKYGTATFPLHSIADFGTPPVYSALRMLAECIQWRLVAGSAKPLDTIQLTVVLVGESQGLAPSTREEIQKGRGQLVTHSLAPEYRDEGALRLLDESYWLFDEYLIAITKGQLGLRRVVVRLPEFRAAFSLHPGLVHLSHSESDRIFAAVPTKVARATDWWHIVYPSQVPTAPDFKGVQFVTGGMRGGLARSGAPCFVSEDLKLLRAPNQDGRRVLTPLEREVALPQWLQHEFFHYLFAQYRDESLEANPHQWLKRKTWPADFEGSGESDYFAEAIHKRIWPHSQPALSQRLRHANVKGGTSYESDLVE